MTDRGRGPDARSTDIASGLGAPSWIARQLNFCPRCGAPLRFGAVAGEERDRSTCDACGHIVYVNPRLVVTTIPVTAEGEIILIRRGLEPGLGAWAQPGGFLEVDESVHEAAVRETEEETGLIVDPGRIVGVYTRLEAAVVVIVLEAAIVGGVATTTPEALEVRAFGPAELPWDGIAFKTTYWALVDWLEHRHPGTTPGGPPAGR
jgi:ADP-ribose pyrophosphatase YjhB (NUDIX family)